MTIQPVNVFVRARGTGKRVALLVLGMSAVLASIAFPRLASAQNGDSNMLATSQLGDPGTFDSMMVLGRRDWSAYVSPDACVQAAIAVDRLVHHMVFPWTDTNPYTPTQVSLSDSARRTASDCGNRFHPATTSARDLLDVAHLALIRGDEADAHAAAVRYVESFPEGDARQWALVNVDTTYLFAKPARFAAADSIAQLLDAYGVSAAEPRANLHEILLAEAERRSDTPRIERELLAVMKAQQQQKIQIDGSYVLRLWGAEHYQSGTDAPERTIGLLKSAGIIMPHMDSLLMMLQLGDAFLRQPVPPLRADFWVGVDSAAQTWPIPGKVSILLIGSPHEYPARAAMWRRIALKYGSALNITFLCYTEGSFHNGPPLTPAQEAERLGRYYREQLKMPVTLAVRETKFEVLPDGRRMPLPHEREVVDRAAGPLVDASGKVITKGFDGGPNGNGETGIMMWIDRALGRDPGTTPATRQPK